MTARGTCSTGWCPADFALVRLPDGAVVGGSPTPSTEVACTWSAIAPVLTSPRVVHVHPQLSVLLAALGHPIRLITTDHVAYVGPVRVAPFRHPGTPELGSEAPPCWPTACHGVVLSHHGCSVVAGSVAMALRRVLNLEEAARLTYAALLLGGAPAAGGPARAIRSIWASSARALTDRGGTVRPSRGRAWRVTWTGKNLPGGGRIQGREVVAEGAQ